jgi:RNA polymerase sigma-70 factor (ECF subfamily)
MAAVRAHHCRRSIQVRKSLANRDGAAPRCLSPSVRNSLPADGGVPMARSDDQTIQLIHQARAGSNDALGRLLEGCRGYLLRIAGLELDPRLRAKGGASDIVQETFLEAQRDFGEFKGDSEQELLAWLRQRVQYRVGKFIRSYRQTAKRAAGREVPLEEGGSSSAAGPCVAADQLSPSEHALALERDHLLEEAMERLPYDYRQVIELRYREGLSFDEIGAVLERSPNSARKLWARAIERLKRDLGAKT